MEVRWERRREWVTEVEESQEEKVWREVEREEGWREGWRERGS